MGEFDDNDAADDLNAQWRPLVEHGDRYAELGPGAHSEQLRAGGPFPPSLRRTPLIVDTDIGGDPDDAFAVAIAARRVPDLALVLTSDERDGERARFARHLLDLFGRSDVPVVAGAQLSDTRYYCVDGLIPAEVRPQTTDVLDAVSRVCEGTDGPVRWVGMGPLSNLCSILRARPDLAERLAITQMGGALKYRDPDRAEHNFRLDPAAASEVLAAAKHIELVISDVTFRPELEISAESPIYDRLGVADAPPWARMLRAHLDRWFATFHPGSIQHDALTLSAGLGLPFVDFDLISVSLDSKGRMGEAADGSRVFLSRAADYAAFMRWLSTQLDLDDAVSGSGPIPTSGDDQVPSPATSDPDSK